MDRADPSRVPPLSLILGFGPALALALCTAGAWAGWPHMGAVGLLWATGILIFLGGVTRGLSFFTDGGPRPGQIAVTMLRFFAGLAAFVLPPVPAILLLMLGYASLAFYDPLAARAGAAPAHFARLRPPQAAIFLLSLAGMLILALL